MTYKYDEPNKQLVENWPDPRTVVLIEYETFDAALQAYNNRPRINVHEDLQKLLKDGQVIDEKEFAKFECDCCDGCGWYEGGIKLKTTCDECKGTGVLAIPLTKEVSKPGKVKPENNKFHKGNGEDGKHYWLTPPDLMKDLQDKYSFDFDACPYPKPVDFDGLLIDWGNSTYVNPPFGSVIHDGKKKGFTAWVRKAISENKKGKKVVLVYPVDKWLLMLLEAGAVVTNLKDVKWVAIEDGTPGKGTGRHIACFELPLTKEVSKPDDWKEKFEDWLIENFKSISGIQAERIADHVKRYIKTINK